jgi:HAD superfamily phosphoserine phosphatase-like hydrolase
MRYMIYSDFDGTITKMDLLDKIIIDLYTYEKYKKGEDMLIDKSITYEKYLKDTFNGIEYDMNKINMSDIDDYFHKFYVWIKENNIEFYIISSGFKKIIEHMLPYVDNTIIYANDIIINNNKWETVLFDGDKSISKNKIIQMLNTDNCKSIYIGDGLTDFEVIGNVDILYCKNNSLLHNKCISKGCEYKVFNTFNDILNDLK